MHWTKNTPKRVNSKHFMCLLKQTPKKMAHGRRTREHKLHKLVRLMTIWNNIHWNNVNEKYFYAIFMCRYIDNYPCPLNMFLIGFQWIYHWMKNVKTCELSIPKKRISEHCYFSSYQIYQFYWNSIHFMSCFQIFGISLICSSCSSYEQSFENDKNNGKKNKYLECN